MRFPETTGHPRSQTSPGCKLLSLRFLCYGRLCGRDDSAYGPARGLSSPQSLDLLAIRVVSRTDPPAHTCELGVLPARWSGDLRELAVETRVNSPSIFDLSPSEKLQLVEDLWDDLAAAPEAVPVHDWQKQELARRKANLLKNPASGLPWEEVKRKVGARYAR